LIRRHKALVFLRSRKRKKTCAEKCLGKDDRNHTKKAFPECLEDERKLPRQRVFSH
jgi:hypothetical protein